MERYWSSPDYFHFTDLDPEVEMRRRGVDDENLLPEYYYRKDALQLWNAILKTVRQLLQLFYTSPDDVTNDSELKVNSVSR
jgi:arachidonate 15-lipoxygenase